MATTSTFRVDDYEAEIAAAPTNYEICTRLMFENERVRVWEMLLEPGERIPFHYHRSPYFWLCHEGGRGIQRFPDGTQLHVEFEPGDTDFLDEGRLETERIHDLENTGDTRARFTTIELLDS
jgi:hypothetical protein